MRKSIYTIIQNFIQAKRQLSLCGGLFFVCIAVGLYGILAVHAQTSGSPLQDLGQLTPENTQTTVTIDQGQPVVTTLPSAVLYWDIISSWDTGYCVEGRLLNTASKPLAFWSLEVSITDIASIVNARYEGGKILAYLTNTTIEAGSAAMFNLCADGSVRAPSYARLIGAGRDENIPIVVTTRPTPEPPKPSMPDNTDSSINPNPNNEEFPTPTDVPTQPPMDSEQGGAPPEILLGTEIRVFNEGGLRRYRIPDVQWAMALAHAAAIVHSKGLDQRYDANALFATAIKESNLGCTTGSLHNPDGCFQIPAQTVFEELKRAYPEIFNHLSHEDIITDNIATSALTKAYYDILLAKMLEQQGYNAANFVAFSNDPNAMVKLLSLSHQLGQKHPEFRNLLVHQRNSCITYIDILDKTRTPTCISDHAAGDRARAIAEITNTLKNAPISGGAYYEFSISWEEIDRYLNSILPLYPEMNQQRLDAEIFHEFENIAQGQPISYRDDFSRILKALLEKLGEVPDPQVTST